MACGQALHEPDAEPAAAASPTVAPTSALPEVDAPAAGEVDLVSCPTCGASNAARRRRCGRCGHSLLAPSERAPVPDDEDLVPVASTGGGPRSGWDDDPPGGARRLGRRRGLGLFVVGLGMVVGTGLGLAAGTGVGPFARLEPVVFDPTAYPRPAAALEPATAGSSSTAPVSDGRAFGPEATVDDDLTTAWRPDGEAEGARVRHAFVAPVWVARIEVATGDQADPDTFTATDRVTEVLVDLGTQRLDVDLNDQDGVQVVTLPDPVLTDQVTWELTATTGDAPAITEVRYVGWPADEADREAFRERS